jgi:Rrf2 family transcriptional regulator, iron-sulfur cluster assembly transcription factor
MRLTSKGRYAVRAMLDLTTHSNGSPVRLQEISNRQNISLHYLEQLFRKLRNGQAVKSVRGPGGGYVLARSMDQITIKQILDCVGENINPAKDIVGSEAENANTVEYHLSRNYFQNLGTIMREYLSTTTLGDLMRKAGDIEVTPRTEEAALATETLANVQQTNSTTSTTEAKTDATSSSFASMIRGPLGEVNQ